MRFILFHLRFWTVALLLFAGNISDIYAQGADLWPEPERILGIYNYSEEPPILVAGKNHIVGLSQSVSVPFRTTSSLGSTNWSIPTKLFEVDGTQQIQWPIIISDDYGNVHLFWTVQDRDSNELSLIFYARKNTYGWTTPVDVVAADVARAPSATIGKDDQIHLIWSGQNGIMYSQAPLQAAEFFRNWSEPLLLTEANPNPGITSSPSGSIHMAAGVKNEGILKQVMDTETGSWHSPRLFPLNSSIESASDYVQLRVSKTGTIHMVWSEFFYPENWPPLGVFYARSTDGGESWSTPEMLDGDGYDQINVHVSMDNTIHAVWNGAAGTGGRYHSWSSNDGLTWSEPTEVIPPGLGGTEGLPQLVEDQTGTLYLLTTYEACAWYTAYQNHVWTAPECISGEEARITNFIEEPAMAVSEGNQLHAVFWDDRKRLWYTTKLTDAAPIPPKTMDSEVVTPVPSPVALEAPADLTAIPTVEPVVREPLESPSRFSDNPGQLLLLSVTPVVIFVISILALQYYLKKR